MMKAKYVMKESMSNVSEECSGMSRRQVGGWDIESERILREF
jgi:hypothetical protein